MDTAFAMSIWQGYEKLHRCGLHGCTLRSLGFLIRLTPQVGIDRISIGDRKYHANDAGDQTQSGNDTCNNAAQEYHEIWAGSGAQQPKDLAEAEGGTQLPGSDIVTQRSGEHKGKYQFIHNADTTEAKAYD